ncbi:hypothetical protein ACFQH9_18365 [Pseudonocardia lutea]|uniref:Chloride channel protein n=1 Tax=Pseudonocardia lutea TaxID=2172015 RepID=A0ABW1I984_9PSEU
MNVDDSPPSTTGAPPPRHLGDFTLNRRVLVTLGWSVPIGALGAVAAWALLRLIALITNAVFFQHLSTAMVSPGAGPHPWWLVLSAPVVGGLVIGLMARYGSEKIRGHGMPEAMRRSSCGAAGWRPGSRCSSRRPRRSASGPAGPSAPRDPSS